MLTVGRELKWWILVMVHIHYITLRAIWLAILVSMAYEATTTLILYLGNKRHDNLFLVRLFVIFGSAFLISYIEWIFDLSFVAGPVGIAWFLGLLWAATLIIHILIAYNYDHTSDNPHQQLTSWIFLFVFLAMIVAIMKESRFTAEMWLYLFILINSFAVFMLMLIVHLTRRANYIQYVLFLFYVFFWLISGAFYLLFANNRNPRPYTRYLSR